MTSILANFDYVFKVFQGLLFAFPVDTSLSIRRRNSMWKVRENYTDSERRIHLETMTSIRRGYFDMDLTFKIDEISMSSPSGYFYVASKSN